MTHENPELRELVCRTCGVPKIDSIISPNDGPKNPPVELECGDWTETILEWLHNASEEGVSVVSNPWSVGLWIGDVFIEVDAESFPLALVLAVEAVVQQKAKQ